MAEILHQLRLVVYSIIYRVLYIPGGAGFLPSTVPLYYSGIILVFYYISIYISYIADPKILIFHVSM